MSCQLQELDMHATNGQCPNDRALLGQSTYRAPKRANTKWTQNLASLHHQAWRQWCSVQPGQHGTRCAPRSLSHAAGQPHPRARRQAHQQHARGAVARGCVSGRASGASVALKNFGDTPFQIIETHSAILFCMYESHPNRRGMHRLLKILSSPKRYRVWQDDPTFSSHGMHKVI